MTLSRETFFKNKKILLNLRHDLSLLSSSANYPVFSRTQLTFAYSKLTVEALGKGVKYVQS